MRRPSNLHAGVPVFMAGLVLSSCWAPQRLVGMELSLDAYRVAVRCVDPTRGTDLCVVRAWELDQLVARNLDCVADADCVVIAGVEPYEVDRLAVNTRIASEVRAAWDGLIGMDACGSYDYFRSADMRTMCKAGRCELVVPARSAIVEERCANGRAGK